MSMLANMSLPLTEAVTAQPVLPGNTDQLMAGVAHLLARFRFRYITEKDLQDGIEAVLTQASMPHRREVVLSAADRPDFVVEGGVAVEVKIKGSLAELLRQASRYAAHPEIAGIVVVGTPHWLSRVPSELGGKPVIAIRLLGSLL